MTGMRALALLVLTFATLACGGSSKPAAPVEPAPAPDPIPSTAGPDCAVVADKLAIVAHADKPDAQAGARAALASRCTNDAWSDDARNCFATIESDAELDGCKQHLSDTQKAKLHEVVPPRDAWTGEPVETAPAGSAPAPAKAAPKKRTTRGATTKEEDAADPQEGGE